MNSKINYSDVTIGDIKIVEDFLPHPTDLVFKDDTIKVTLDLSCSSFAYIQCEAERKNMPYQTVIRRILDEYSHSHQQV